MLYILQTSPIFRFSISDLAKGQLKQGKLYFTKISTASGIFKISARVVFAVICFIYQVASQPPSITTVEPVI